MTDQTTTATATPSPPLHKMGYSLREAAQLLSISYISAFRLCQRGKLRSASGLRKKIIPHTELERFLRA